MNLRIVIPVIVIALVCGFFVYFWLRYVRPAKLIKERILALSQALAKLKSDSDSSVPKEAVAVLMKADSTLQHLWSEYEETLHDQYGVNQDGETVVLKIRATVPSEVFFNTQVLVDTPIQAEFFRHLPGILTGIGIIGTFLGLLFGLSGFKTNDLGMITNSVEILLESVRDAFIASAVAISCAMVVTYFEKRLLAECYKQVEELAQNLDMLYEAGAGEEYLSRLVMSSEENAVQARTLKDSLVGDLKQLMTELVERQINAGMDNSRLIASQVGDAITSNFQRPLERIAAAVETTQGSQTEAFKGGLQDLLSAYIAEMNNAVGGQMENLNKMMGESVRSLNAMQEGFQGLLADLKNVGRDTNESMLENLQKMLEQTDTKQGEMLKQISGFIDQMQAQMLKSQSASQNQLEQSIEVIGSQMATLFSDFKLQRTKIFNDEKAHRARTQEETEKFVGSIESSLTGFTENMTAIVTSLTENIQVLQGVAVRSAERVDKSIDSMNLTAKSFADSGNALSKALTQGTALFDKVASISVALEQSSRAVQETVLSYERTRNTVEQMTVALSSTIRDAESRVGLSRELLADMEKYARKAAEFQTQTREYMDNVTNVLGISFNSFGDAVKRNLETSHGAFASTLTEAVSTIAGLLQELEEKLENFNEYLNKIVQVRG